MTNASTDEGQITHEQRRVLDLVYEPFGSGGAWPTADAIQRRLFRGGERRLDVGAVLAGLPPGLVRRDGTVGGKVELTLRGLQRMYRSAELNDFIQFLLLAIERYGSSDEPKVGAYDLVQKHGFDERRLRKLATLLEQEFFLTSGTARPRASVATRFAARDVRRAVAPPARGGTSAGKTQISRARRRTP